MESKSSILFVGMDVNEDSIDIVVADAPRDAQNPFGISAASEVTAQRWTSHCANFSFAAEHPRWEPSVWDLCGGQRAISVPTANHQGSARQRYGEPGNRQRAPGYLSP